MKPNEQSKKELMHRALVIARGIVAGEIDPNAGCAQLGDINRALDWPPELSAFGLLAHEQHDHESLGITAEGCVPEIIKECRTFIDASS